jgi:hypothetical protein
MLVVEAKLKGKDAQFRLVDSAIRTVQFKAGVSQAKGVKQPCQSQKATSEKALASE